MRLPLLASLFISDEHRAATADGICLLEEVHALLPEEIDAAIDASERAGDLPRAEGRRAAAAQFVVAAAAVDADVV